MSMSLAAGSRLGPYEVVALIGAGGMGEVYRARDTKLDRDVALKVLPDLFAGDPEMIGRISGPSWGTEGPFSDPRRPVAQRDSADNHTAPTITQSTLYAA